MSSARYIYNKKTLSFEEVVPTWKDRMLGVLSYLSVGAIMAVLMTVAILFFVDSPKEKILKRENAQLKAQYQVLNSELGKVDKALQDIQHRDDNIYRVIFEADPIPKDVRAAGRGGLNRYADLENYQHSELMIGTQKRLDKIARQLTVQSKSFDEVVILTQQKEKMLSSIPAIQPIANKNLTRMSSGFGYRIDPIYKTKKMHAGMDFTAPRGTPIYTTGDGRVVKTKRSRRGYGNHVVIDHGFGYKTLYAHMSAIDVRRGQKVKRGEVIGRVGNSGKSVGPHLHYEVWKNGSKINPVNFYFNDLSPEAYEAMIELSAAEGQSLD